MGLKTRARAPSSTAPPPKGDTFVLFENRPCQGGLLRSGLYRGGRLRRANSGAPPLVLVPVLVFVVVIVVVVVVVLLLPLLLSNYYQCYYYYYYYYYYIDISMARTGTSSAFVSNVVLKTNTQTNKQTSKLERVLVLVLVLVQ